MRSPALIAEAVDTPTGPMMLLTALASTAWLTTPQAPGLLEPQIDAATFEVSTRRARALISRSLFPLAYVAGRRWYN